MSTDQAIPFSWNVSCQVCFKKIKASEAIKRWDGLIVCSDDNEQRHSLDMPAPPYREQRPISFTSPEPEDIEIQVITVSSRSAVVGLAIVGLAVVGTEYVSNNYEMPAGTFTGSPL